MLVFAIECGCGYFLGTSLGYTVIRSVPQMLGSASLQSKTAFNNCFFDLCYINSFEE
jgi:hypothetical protein